MSSYYGWWTVYIYAGRGLDARISVEVRADTREEAAHGADCLAEQLGLEDGSYSVEVFGRCS